MSTSVPETADETASCGKKSDANDYSRFEELSDSSSSDDEKDHTSVSVGDRLQQAGTAKLEGNNYIKSSEWKSAAAQYRKGLKVLEDLGKAKPAANPVQLSEAKDLELSLNLNIAMAELKLQGWAAAIKAATKAIAIDPGNVKALFRRGQAASKSGALDEAATDLSACLKIDPTNSVAKKELAGVKKRQLAHRQQTKKSFGGLFERSGGMYEDKEEERRQKEAQKAAAEAARKAKYEEEMTTAEAAALAEASKAQGEDAPAPFERTSYEAWCEAKDEEAKKKKEAEEADEKAAKAKKEAELVASRKASGETTKARAQHSGNGGSEALELDEEDAALLADMHKGSLKGYKVTTDGRKTTYFNNDLDDEAKKLIGNITPQKISDGSVPQSAAASQTEHAARGSSGGGAPQRIDAKGGAGAGSGGSAWNKGGTWEERDCSAWAHASLKNKLLGGTAASGAEDLDKTSPEALVKAFEGVSGLGNLGGLGAGADNSDSMAGLAGLAGLTAALARVTAKVTKVGKVDGDASVAVVRGTKRYIFDMSAEVDYEVLVDESFGMDESTSSTTPARQAKYKGKLVLPEVTHDAGSDLEVNTRPKTKVPEAHAARVETALAQLKKDITQRCIASFAAEFQTSF